MNKNVLWITRTALFVAILVIIQFTTSFLNNTLITGSLVNLTLIICVMICGPASGIAAATLSPIFAKLVGIGPLWSIIPFIMLGNISLVLCWNFIGRQKTGNKNIAHIAAALTAAAVKFLVLYIGIVKLAVPVLLELPEPQASVISGTFSIPQLITALIGGVIAVVILPVVQKAVNNTN